MLRGGFEAVGALRRWPLHVPRVVSRSRRREVLRWLRRHIDDQSGGGADQIGRHLHADTSPRRFSARAAPSKASASPADRHARPGGNVSQHLAPTHRLPATRYPLEPVTHIRPHPRGEPRRCVADGQAACFTIVSNWKRGNNIIYADGLTLLHSLLVAFASMLLCGFAAAFILPAIRVGLTLVSLALLRLL